MKVSEMKELMKNANLDELRKLAAEWEQDERAGVHRQVLFTIGLVLFVFIMIINVTLNKILKKGDVEQ